jgi:hypothetical protein
MGSTGIGTESPSAKNRTVNRPFHAGMPISCLSCTSPVALSTVLWNLLTRCTSQFLKLHILIWNKALCDDTEMAKAGNPRPRHGEPSAGSRQTLIPQILTQRSKTHFAWAEPCEKGRTDTGENGLWDSVLCRKEPKEKRAIMSTNRNSCNLRSFSVYGPWHCGQLSVSNNFVSASFPALEP